MKSKLFRTAMSIITVISVFCILSACGTIVETFDGMTGKKDMDNNDENAIMVEVIVESDSNSIVDLEIELNARENPEMFSFDSVEAPYRDEFSVSKDVPIPITSTRVVAKKADDASWVSCTILYDGKEVSTHRAQKDGEKAVCEKTFRLGPG